MLIRRVALAFGSLIPPYYICPRWDKAISDWDCGSQIGNQNLTTINTKTARKIRSSELYLLWFLVLSGRSLFSVLNVPFSEQANETRGTGKQWNRWNEVSDKTVTPAIRRCAFSPPARPRSRYYLLSLTLSTARNASWGISTRPIFFIRFLPSFCFSSSLRLREISPP